MRSLRTASVVFGFVLVSKLGWGLDAGLARGSADSAARDTGVHEEVRVERVVVDAHVIDDRGGPILGLGAEDFRVRVDGHPATIESIEWIDEAQAYAEGLAPAEATDAGVAEAPRGRLIVLFFQTDFARVRVTGHVRMMLHALELLENLGPHDRVAVVSHDSHLKLRQDFTADHDKIAAAIRKSILIDDPVPPEEVPPPSLFAGIDARAARDAATPEQAMILLGDGLEPIPGLKTMIFLGFGLGHLGREGVSMDRSYGSARGALARARTALFSLDTSDADHHALEAGLRKAAKDNGGFYIKTNRFPRFAIQKMARALAGHYVLVVNPPALDRGHHEIDVELPDRAGNVLARDSYDDAREGE